MVPIALFNGFFADFKTTFLIPSHITSDGSLDVPGRPLVDILFGHGKGIVNNSLLQSHAEEKFTDTIDVSSIVRVLYNRFSCTEAIRQLVPELVPHDHILDAIASFLLLDLPSVSLVCDDGSLKDFLEVISLLLLFP